MHASNLIPQSILNVLSIGWDIKLEACIRQRAVQSLRSGEKRERASWIKRGMSLIRLTRTIDIWYL